MKGFSMCIKAGLTDLNKFLQNNATCILQRRFLSEKRICIPDVEYLTNEEGNVIGPKPAKLPQGLDVDPTVTESGVFSKHHRGTMHMKTPELPELLQINARHLLANESLLNSKKLKEDLNHLNQVYLRRQPRMETKIKKDILNSIMETQFLAYVNKHKLNLESMEEEQVDDVRTHVLKQSRNIFRKTTHNWKSISYSGYSALTYLVARMAPNYRVLVQIFHELYLRDPKFVPGSIYDLGSGVGSVVWAANTIWQNKVFEYYCVDSSKYMNDLSQKLLAKDIDDPLSSSIPGVYFRQFALSANKNQFRMVVSAYTLMEQPTMAKRMELVAELWKQTQNYLVLVEHGTEAGYKLIMAARDQILKMKEKQSSLEGHVYAPCTHDVTCPKLKLRRKPCTFSVWYKEMSIHSDFERQSSKLLEKYSYIVMKKGARKRENDYPRILDIIQKSKFAHCKMCCPDGTYRQHGITKTRPSLALYNCIKGSEQGDFLPVDWPANSKTGESEQKDDSQQNKTNTFD